MYFIAGLVRSTLLYGLISLLVCVFVPQVAATTEAEGFVGGFYSFMYVSAVAYPVLLAIHPLIVRIGHRRRSMPFSYSRSLLGALGADLTNPFRGVAAFKGASRVIDSKGRHGAYAWGQVTVHLIWAALFLIYLIVAWTLLLTS